MGYLKAKVGKIEVSKPIPVMAFASFLVANRIIDHLDQLPALGTLYFPRTSPEFIIRPVETENRHPILDMMGPPTPNISIEYDGEIFTHTIPKHLFNYLCFWVAQTEDITYPNIQSLMDHYKISK